MKAAIVETAGTAPVYGDFETPTAAAGEELISVRASALSQFAKAKASGAHYSSGDGYPAIAGADGVGLTQDGRRVYFALPQPPFGTLAEYCPVPADRCIPIPDAVDDITAAAIANPGMSAWAALVERGRLVAGETVLINGATGTAGRLAVQLARHLGAGRIVATGRNAEELEQVKALGADIVLPFTLDPAHPEGAKAYELGLRQAFASGIGVVVDYLWGESAKTVMVAIAKAVEDAAPVRFVHVGEAGGAQNIELPGAALRSSSILLMGSGAKSVPLPRLMQAVASVFDAIEPAGLKIATHVEPLARVGDVWNSAPGKPRVVFSICQPAVSRPGQ